MNISPILAHGTDTRDIRACMDKLGLPAPAYSWYEPRPGSALDGEGRQREGLTPSELHPTLRPGPLEAPAGLALDEARLFWSRGSLYLIDEGESTRWSFWAVPSDDPATTEALRAIEARCASGDAVCTDAAGAGPGISSVCDLLYQPVLRRRDLERFGIHTKETPGRIKLLLLRADGALIGWTLTGDA